MGESKTCLESDSKNIRDKVDSNTGCSNTTRSLNSVQSISFENINDNTCISSSDSKSTSSSTSESTSKSNSDASIDIIVSDSEEDKQEDKGIGRQENIIEHTTEDTIGKVIISDTNDSSTKSSHSTTSTNSSDSSVNESVKKQSNVVKCGRSSSDSIVEINSDTDRSRSPIRPKIGDAVTHSSLEDAKFVVITRDKTENIVNTLRHNRSPPAVIASVNSKVTREIVSDSPDDPMVSQLKMISNVIGEHKNTNLNLLVSNTSENLTNTKERDISIVSESSKVASVKRKINKSEDDNTDSRRVRLAAANYLKGRVSILKKVERGKDTYAVINKTALESVDLMNVKVKDEPVDGKNCIESVHGCYENQIEIENHSLLKNTGNHESNYSPSTNNVKISMKRRYGDTFNTDIESDVSYDTDDYCGDKDDSDYESKRKIKNTLKILCKRNLRKRNKITDIQSSGSTSLNIKNINYPLSGKTQEYSGNNCSSLITNNSKNPAPHNKDILKPISADVNYLDVRKGRICNENEMPTVLTSNNEFVYNNINIAAVIPPNSLEGPIPIAITSNNCKNSIFDQALDTDLNVLTMTNSVTQMVSNVKIPDVHDNDVVADGQSTIPNVSIVSNSPMISNITTNLESHVEKSNRGLSPIVPPSVLDTSQVSAVSTNVNKHMNCNNYNDKQIRGKSSDKLNSDDIAPEKCKVETSNNKIVSNNSVSNQTQKCSLHIGSGSLLNVHFHNNKALSSVTTTNHEPLAQNAHNSKSQHANVELTDGVKNFFNDFHHLYCTESNHNRCGKNNSEVNSDSLHNVIAEPRINNEQNEIIEINDDSRDSIIDVSDNPKSHNQIKNQKLNLDVGNQEINIELNIKKHLIQRKVFKVVHSSNIQTIKLDNDTDSGSDTRKENSLRTVSVPQPITKKCKSVRRKIRIVTIKRKVIDHGKPNSNIEVIEIDDDEEESTNADHVGDKELGSNNSIEDPKSLVECPDPIEIAKLSGMKKGCKENVDPIEGKDLVNDSLDILENTTASNIGDHTWKDVHPIDHNKPENDISDVIISSMQSNTQDNDNAINSNLYPMCTVSDDFVTEKIKDLSKEISQSNNDTRGSNKNIQVHFADNDSKVRNDVSSNITEPDLESLIEDLRVLTKNEKTTRNSQLDEQIVDFVLNSGVDKYTGRADTENIHLDNCNMQSEAKNIDECNNKKGNIEKILNDYILNTDENCKSTECNIEEEFDDISDNDEGSMSELLNLKSDEEFGLDLSIKFYVEENNNYTIQRKNNCESSFDEYNLERIEEKLDNGINSENIQLLIEKCASESKFGNQLSKYIGKYQNKVMVTEGILSEIPYIENISNNPNGSDIDDTDSENNIEEKFVDYILNDDFTEKEKIYDFHLDVENSDISRPASDYNGNILNDINGNKVNIEGLIAKLNADHLGDSETDNYTKNNNHNEVSTCKISSVVPNLNLESDDYNIDYHIVNEYVEYVLNNKSSEIVFVDTINKATGITLTQIVKDSVYCQLGVKGHQDFLEDNANMIKNCSNLNVEIGDDEYSGVNVNSFVINDSDNSSCDNPIVNALRIINNDFDEYVDVVNFETGCNGNNSNYIANSRDMTEFESFPTVMDDFALIGSCCNVVSVNYYSQDDFNEDDKTYIEIGNNVIIKDNILSSEENLIDLNTNGTITNYKFFHDQNIVHEDENFLDHYKINGHGTNDSSNPVVEALRVINDDICKDVIDNDYEQVNFGCKDFVSVNGNDKHSIDMEMVHNNTISNNKTTVNYINESIDFNNIDSMSIVNRSTGLNCDENVKSDESEHENDEDIPLDLSIKSKEGMEDIPMDLSSFKESSKSIEDINKDCTVKFENAKEEFCSARNIIKNSTNLDKRNLRILKYSHGQNVTLPSKELKQSNMDLSRLCFMPERNILNSVPPPIMVF